MNEFGILLRNFRESCRDPDFPARRLPQQKFGAFVGQELGLSEGYSGAAVSDWERGKSKIHADDRLVLAAIIKVLYRHGGIKTIQDAHQLLSAGNYRTLNEKEIHSIFQDVPNGLSVEQTSESTSLLWLADMFSFSREELDNQLLKAREGPGPVWPQTLAFFMRKASEHISLSITSVVWIGIWMLAIGSLSPSLRFPFARYDAAFSALALYVAGSLTLPLLIGVMVNTKDSGYWKQKGKTASVLLRLYTHQGAGVGFNVGYFLVFPLSLIRYYLGFGPAIWIEILAATVAVILGSMGARVVPHNLWLAYERLTLRDGGIFFIVSWMSPLWAFFFLEFYSTLLHPVLGITVILLALMGVVIVSRRLAKKQTTS